MSYANPYAAPQTNDLPFDPSTLPTAVLAESDGTRQMFPERTTAALEQLVQTEEVLIGAQTMWFWVTGLLGILSLYTLTTIAYHTVASAFIYGGLPLIVAPFAGVRLYAGYARNTSDRYFAILMDWLLFTASFGLTIFLIVFSMQLFQPKHSSSGISLQEILVFVLGLPTLFYSGYTALNCVKALSSGQVLFGPQRLRYQDLVEELDYRQTHGIE